jgi:hypothetical protein
LGLGLGLGFEPDVVHIPIFLAPHAGDWAEGERETQLGVRVRVRVSVRVGRDVLREIVHADS